MFGYLPATIIALRDRDGRDRLRDARFDMPKSTSVHRRDVVHDRLFGVGTVAGAWLADRGPPRSTAAGAAALAGVWMFALFPLVGDAELRVDRPRRVGRAARGRFDVRSRHGNLGSHVPAHIRYAGVSLGTQFSNIIGGGLALFTMVALYAATGTSLSTRCTSPSPQQSPAWSP
ncbi:MHS family MFS transporter [Pseudonocardia sp. MCCB 268]|nr:MHS family MFS transporter [Pseudonocardia cytotoxica]